MIDISYYQILIWRFFSFSKISGMKDLMQLIESKQFMAHANSILEAESNTTTNAGDKVCNMLNSILFANSRLKANIFIRVRHIF